MNLKKKYIGDRAFYSRMFAVMLPVLLQNVITNFVNLLDNVMVGRVGTEPMSGVAIVNQLLFVFNLCVFGGLAGAGIFTAQYYGKGDKEGVRNSMRAKAWIAFWIFLVFGLVFAFFREKLLMLFIHEGQDDINLEATLDYGLKYLRIISIQMPLFAAINVYASSLRETGETKLPMKASIISVCVNLFLNWVLIYGKLGAPALGVEGAAIATVIARVAELSFLITKTGRRFGPVWKTMRVPKELALQITRKSLPLMINELLWSGGMTTLVQIMSLRGVEVVSAENIANTVSNLFFCSYFAMGSTISIMVGQLLGAGELEQAVDENRKLTFFSVVFSSVIGIIMIFVAPYIPLIYNTTDMVRSYAADFIIITAIMMPCNAYTNACFFALRSGGKVLITMLYDSVYIWVLSIPLTRVLVLWTALGVEAIYAVSYFVDIVKCVFGFILVRNRSWVNNLVED